MLGSRPIMARGLAGRWTCGRFRETDRREEVGLNLSVCACVAVFENNIKKKGGNRQQNTKKYTERTLTQEEVAGIKLN